MRKKIPVPRVSAEHMQARKDHITRAAVTQFSSRGIHSTSMANIIDASGLSAGAIYTYFDSKDDIITYAALTAITTVLSDIRALLNTEPLPSPPDVISRIISRIDAIEPSPGFIVQVWSEAVTNPVVHDTINNVYQDALKLLQDYLTGWLITHEDYVPSRARATAPSRARILLSIIYSSILQKALIDTYSGSTTTADIATLWT